VTSREILRRVLTFDGPSRIGLSLPKPYENDFLGVSPGPAAGFTPRRLAPQGSERRRWRDEWGVVWHSLTEYDKGEVAEGAITDWSQLDSYRCPDLGDPARYERMKALFAADGEKFRMGHLPGFIFNIARKIRKLDNYLCDLILERANVDRLTAMIREQLLAAIDRIADAGAEAIGFCEDWGTQSQLMIDPALWREIFKGEFATLCQAAHDRGMFVIMHSCGKVTDIIPDLIEVGVNCFQFDQPRLHGLEKLAEFHGRVSFWCPVDIQTTLQTRDAGKIRADARTMIDQLGGKAGGQHGGFIGGYYGGNQAIGLTPDVQDHACRAFVEYGNYG